MWPANHQPDPAPAFPGRIAVVGAGAVGAYYGGRLAAAGHPVAFLVRRDYQAWRRHGLIVRSCAGDFTVDPVAVHRDPAEIGPRELVIIALKATANPDLPALLAPLLTAGTTLLTLQNGLGNDDFLAARYGPQRVLGGLCFTCINRDEQGVIHHLAQGHVNLGEYQRPPGPRIDALVAAFKAAGVPASAAPDLAGAQWRKLVWNIPFNGLAIAAGGLDCAALCADPALAARARELMLEVLAAAAALGHPLAADLPDQQLALTRGMGPYRPSSLIDYLEGRPVELDAIWSEPLRRARAAGLAVPALARLEHEIRARLAART
jgi:2-dehydropantoate 2-reductase